MKGALPLPGFVETPLVDPFELYVGPVFESGPPGRKRYALRLDSRHLNRRGVMHGGMMMTLADLAFGQAVWDATEKTACVTLNMQTHFVRPAKEGDIVEVKPELLRRTGGLVFMRGDFTVGENVIFASCSVWKLLGRD